MKPIQFILFIIITGLLGVSSCKKDEPKVWTELPPPTQTGENTMGCLVDGKLWATSKKLDFSKFPAFRATYADYGDYVHLEFYASGSGGRVAFVVNNPSIGQNEAAVSCSFDMILGCSVLLYSVSLNITKMDLEKGILSGLFAFDLPCKEDENKTLHITEGRFDLYMTVLLPQN